jgi:hypothetical protein
MFRHGHKVDVIGHQTVAEETDAMAHGVAAEQMEVEAAILGGPKDGLAIVPTLRDVMGHSRNDKARTAGHNIGVARRRGSSQD